MTDPDFGTALRRLRERAALTREELAERTGLSPRGISALERGERRRPHPHTVRALAAALGVSPDDWEELLAAPPSLDRHLAARAPAGGASLVGRESERSALRALIIDQGVRLTTIVGPGGVGKTELARALAQDLDDHFGDGTAMVSLSSVSDPEQVLPAIADALRLHETSDATLATVLGRYLATRQMVLVLDNLEQLAGSSTVLTGLLREAPQLAILATSRVRLRLRDEHLVVLEPLAPSPAVELFRLRAAQAGADLRGVDPGVLTRLCTALDGLPLAIELAAARTRVLSPEALLERLDQLLQLLVGGAQDAPERHRALSDTVAWSERLLRPEERRLFRRLGVLRGEWSVAAAAAVGRCSVDQALGRLSALVDASLVVPAAHGPHVRFRLLETIAAYAREQLARRGEVSATRKRHAAHFLEVAEDTYHRLFSAEQAAVVETLRADDANLREAMRWIATHEGPDRLARACLTLTHFWVFVGRLSEAAAWCDLVLDSAEAPSPEGRALAQYAKGIALYTANAFGEAARALDAAAPALRRIGDSRMLLIMFAMRALAGVVTGDGDAAAAALEEADRLPSAEWLAPGPSLLVIARVVQLLSRGELEKAEGVLVPFVAEARQGGTSPVELGWVLMLHGLVAMLGQRLDDAQRLEYEALDSLLAASESVATVANALENLADIAVEHGDLHRAAVLYGASDAFVERGGVGVFPRFPGADPRALAEEGMGSAAFAAAKARGRVTPAGELLRLAEPR